MFGEVTVLEIILVKVSTSNAHYFDIVHTNYYNYRYFYLLHNYLFVHLFQTRKGSDRLNKFMDIVGEITQKQLTS